MARFLLKIFGLWAMAARQAVDAREAAYWLSG